MNLDQAFDLSLMELESKGFENIREPERVLATIWAVEAEVNNGGFNQFFYNAAGDLSFYAVKALSSVGANQMAQITQKALDLFGDEGPPIDRDLRVSKLTEFEDENENYLDKLDYEFTEYPDNLIDLLDVYVEKHFKC